MSESDLPVSLSEISRNSTSATDSIGTMTMSTKNSRRRARKLIELHYGPVLGAIAQLGERLDRTQEVGGSSPPSSIGPGSAAVCGVRAFWFSGAVVAVAFPRNGEGTRGLPNRHSFGGSGRRRPYLFAARKPHLASRLNAPGNASHACV